MPTPMFNNYKVYYWASTRAARLGFNIQVDLYYDTSQVGTLKFYPDDSSSLPSDQIYAMSKGSIIHLHYYVSQFEHIIDLIRNESPLFIYFSRSAGTPGSFTRGEGDIRTSNEPVGEEEGS